MPIRPPHRQRGTVYLLVLSVTGMLVAIGVTAVIVGRIGLQTETLQAEQSKARVLAQSSVRLIRTVLNDDGDWRTSYANNNWYGPVDTGSGLVRYKLVDEGDDDLTNDATDAVRLYVEATVGDAVRVYSVVLRPGTSVTAEFPIVTSSDDAGQSVGLGVNATTIDYLLIGQDGLVGGIAAVRFDDLPLSQGQTVLAAQIQFTSKDARSDATAISIQAQAADDAPTFNALPFNISGRPKTSEQAVWAPGAWTADARGAEQLTTDLSAVMQEVIDRPGWRAGNAVAFFLEGTKARNPRTYDHSTAAAPVLHLIYADENLAADYTTLRREMAE